MFKININITHCNLNQFITINTKELLAYSITKMLGMLFIPDVLCHYKMYIKSRATAQKQS